MEKIAGFDDWKDLFYKWQRGYRLQAHTMEPSLYNFDRKTNQVHFLNPSLTDLAKPPG